MHVEQRQQAALALIAHNRHYRAAGGASRALRPSLKPVLLPRHVGKYSASRPHLLMSRISRIIVVPRRFMSA